jgi:hypothetical protein
MSFSRMRGLSEELNKIHNQPKIEERFSSINP